MSQKHNQLEEYIRQRLENYEVEYNPSHWSEMENRLNLLQSGLAVSMQTFYGAFAIAGVLMAGLIYFGMPSSGVIGMVAEEEEKIELEQSDGLLVAEEQASQSQRNSPEDMSSTGIDTFVMDMPTNRIESWSDEDEGNLNSSENKNSDISESSKSSNDNSSNSPEFADKSKLVKYGEMKVRKIKSSVSQGCEGTPITFSTSGSESDGNFLWNFGDGYFSNDHNPVHIFDAPGIFDVSLLVTPLTGGKLTPMTIEDQIKINPRPQALFEFTYQENELNMPQIKLENRTKNVDRAIWKIGGEVISDEINAIQKFSRKGTYNVELIAMNAHGCADTSVQKVVIKEDYNLLAPKQFSPHQNGKTQTFMPPALAKIGGEFTLRIIDPRTGMIIFESTEYSVPWDGTIAGTSVKASSGHYDWQVEVVNQNGSMDQFSGDVKLLK